MSDPSDTQKVTFHPYDDEADVEITSRHLPHWFQPEVVVFLTFRTADSMPRKVVELWRREQEAWLSSQQLPAAPDEIASGALQIPHATRQSFLKVRNRLWHESLDACHGACLLRRRALAQIVSDSLRHFDGDRYDLDSFVIMPNHVHLLVQFRPPVTMRAQVASWLRFTARRINEQVGRKGPFWQPEPFDHLVRSAEQFFYLQKYIRENPMKAKLAETDYLYWSRRQ